MTKKGHKKFRRMKIEKKSGKGKICEIFHGIRKFFGNRGGSETEGKCIIALGGMDAPVYVSIHVCM